MGQPAYDLHDQIDELQERVKQLEDMLAGDCGSIYMQELSPAEQRTLNCLMKHERPSIEMLYCATVPYSNQGETDARAIQVRIHHVRRKLKPYGVHVHLSWGRGYFMTPDDKEKLRRACAG